MKTKKEIREKIREEIERIPAEKGHMGSICRGWIDALEWVLECRD